VDKSSTILIVVIISIPYIHILRYDIYLYNLLRKAGTLRCAVSFGGRLVENDAVIGGLGVVIKDDLLLSAEEEESLSCFVVIMVVVE
jgi:hypothetical protein